MTAANPDFAHGDIGERDRVARAADLERERPTRSQRFENNFPRAVGRGRRDLLILKLDSDFFTVGGGTPDGHVHLLLQDRVLGEERVRLDLGVGDGGEDETS